MKRSLTSVGAAALAAVVALTLAACGSSSDDGTAAADPSDTAATRTVSSPFTGKEVTIPTHPQRVVALWRTGSEVADLGVVPVATLEGEMLETELGDTYAAVKDVPTVGTFEGVDVEKVIAAKPDLIIGMDNGGLSIDYSELEEVAPTVILKIAEPTDVWDNYPTIADLVGKSTDFEAKQKDLDTQLAAIKEQHGDTLGKIEVTSLNAMQGSIYVSTSKALDYRRITAAGFGYNADYTKNPERYAAELSAENLGDLSDQGAIFYNVDVQGKPSADVQALLDSASFKRLPAAQDGHVYPLTSGTVYTLSAAQKQVDDLKAAADDLAGDK